MTKIINENKNRFTVNDFIFACSFIYLFIYFYFYLFIYFYFFILFIYFIFFFFCLIITSDVIICIGYTIFANTLNF